MDGRINELLSRIQELDDQSLLELRDLVIQALGPGDFTGTEEELSALSAAVTALQQEQLRRIKLPNGPREVIASARRAAASSTLAVPAGRGLNPSRHGIATAVTASGVEIRDRRTLADEFRAAIRSNWAANAENGRVRIATIRASASDREKLHPNDGTGNTNAITAAAVEHEALIRDVLARVAKGDVTALTAAGGLGAPEQTDYTLNGFETVERPVKGALPVFTTDRGGVRFMRPPTLNDVDGVVGIWTVADDVAAVTDSTIRKPSFRLTPGAEIVVDLQATTSSLIFGNLIMRAYPEFVDRVMDLALAAHARVSEQQLLTQLGALSTRVTSQPMDETTGLGATRVLLPLLDRTAIAMRNRMRMDPNAPLQLILPDWARGVLRSDLALQEPGDATLGVTDAELAQYLATRNLAPTWARDGEAGQQFDVQAPGPVNAWPAEVISYMFPAGAFQFLDGGTLDLGLIRDSTLNSANDAQIFSETFEGLLYRGGEAFRITTPVTPNGIARAAAAS